MIGLYASLPQALDMSFQLSGVLDVDDARLSRMESDVHRLSQMSQAFIDHAHPWSGALASEWGDRLQAKVEEELSSLIDTRDRLASVLLTAGQALGLTMPEALPEVRRWRLLYRDLAERPSVRREWLEGDLDLLIRMTGEGHVMHQEVSELEKQLLTMGSRDILDLDGRAFKQRFEVDYAGALRALKGAFRQDMKVLQAISGRSMTYHEARHMVVTVERYQQVLASWKVRRDDLITALKGAFSGDGTELQGLVERLNWTRSFRTNHALLLNSQVIDALTSSALARNISDAGVDLELNLGRFDSALNVFLLRFAPDRPINGRPPRDALLNDIRTWTDRAWEARYRYQEWLDLTALMQGMEALGLSDALKDFKAKRVPTEGMLPAFQKRFRRLWTEAALASEPALNRFRRDQQMGLIEKFRQLDQMYVEGSRHRVQAQVRENIRKRRTGPDHAVTSEAGDRDRPAGSS